VEARNCRVHVPREERTTATFYLLPCSWGRTRENRMNSNQVRSNDMVLDGWPILVAFALYLVAFGIVAMTMATGMAAA
jgi:hypothetical protein